MAGSVILAGARTPIGKLSGALGGFAATDLGGFAIKAALERSGVAPDQVDYVFMGQVLQAGTGQITARQAATNAGIPMTVPATTVNKVCLSGLNAIFLADLLIQSGAADIVVAGGMESMTQAPYLLPGAREGYRLGDKSVVDSMMYDGLFCAFDQVAMGAGTEEYAASAGLAREPQDDLAAKSHEQPPPPSRRGASRRRSSRSRCPSARATRSWSTPTRASAPAPRPSRWPSSARVRQGRQHHRRQRLADLRRGRRRGGGVQGGGRAPGRRAAGRDRGLRPGGRPDPSLLTQPSRAINAALETAGRSVGDVDLFELNEAFAAVGLASMTDLGITDEVVNVNGGAIALGHPSACRAPRWPSRCCTSSSVAAVAPVRPPCAAAAARATPSCSRPDGDARPRASGSAGPPAPAALKQVEAASTVDLLVPSTSFRLQRVVRLAATVPSPRSVLTSQRPPSKSTSPTSSERSTLVVPMPGRTTAVSASL